MTGAMEARTPAPWDGRTVVYRLFNAAGSCIYVGCTRNFTSRIYDHRTKSPFAAQIARARITVHADRETALAAERCEIQRIRPRHNINGRGRRGYWTPVDYVEVLESLRARSIAGVAQNCGTGGPNYLDAKRIAAEFEQRFPEIASVVLERKRWAA